MMIRCPIPLVLAFASLVGACDSDEGATPDSAAVEAAKNAPASGSATDTAHPDRNTGGEADPPKLARRVEDPVNPKPGELVRVKEFHENGQLATERTERVLEGGQRVRQGAMKAWHENGQLYVDGGYDDDGRLSGRWKYWNDDGELQREGDYEKGLREGDWIENWPNGRRYSQGFIHVGLLEGPWKYWHDNGQQLAEGEYVNNLRAGEWLFWLPDGAPDAAQSGTYEKNTKVR